MILATPGPVEIPLFVRETFLGETIHHRTPEFKEILLETLERFKNITHLPHNVFLSSSGSGAMEAAVINTANKALTINAGKFGERWGKICKAFDIDYEEIKYDISILMSVVYEGEYPYESAKLGLKQLIKEHKNFIIANNLSNLIFYFYLQKA